MNVPILKKDKVLSFRVNVDVVMRFNLQKKIQDLINQHEIDFCNENNFELSKNQKTRISENKTFSKWLDLADNNF